MGIKRRKKSGSIKRPTGTNELLLKVSKQLKGFERYLEDRSCIGCGKLGMFLCPHCRELHEAVKERIRKLWGTVEVKFARHKL